MTRTCIRDNRSTLGVKPRVLDLIINDNGMHEIEVKDGRTKKTILLSDLQEQITKALKMNTVTTEPPIR